MSGLIRNALLTPVEKDGPDRDLPLALDVGVDM